jgi:uncharacterized protein (DUF924 family)
MTKLATAQTIIDFWFYQIEKSQWWVKDTEFDQRIKTEFLELHQMANKGELFHWRKTPEGRLAEIIILDQFSRNMFRNQPESFASDPIALVLAQEAIQTGDVNHLPQEQRDFLLMPLMHSESKVIHEYALPLFEEMASEFSMNFELKHKVIIDEFGRYPHRNDILKRPSTQKELVFLTQENSSF